MALNVIQVKPVSRSAGRSATAAAAYRSGEAIKCEREGRTHDYTRKGGIDKEAGAIILPSDVSSDLAKDRQTLWNAAEQSEKRKDARVAREYIIALPAECSAQEREKLARDFAQTIADRYGVAVDLNLHQPHRNSDGSDNLNYHAHLLTTTRQISAEGLGQKSDIELSDSTRTKRGMTSGAAEIYQLREVWTGLQNQVLEKYGVAVKAESLKNQGGDIEPTLHMGAEITALERQGIRTSLGDINREIIARNETRQAEKAQFAGLDMEIRLTQDRISSLEAAKGLLIQGDKEKQESHSAARDTLRELAQQARERLTSQASNPEQGTDQTQGLDAPAFSARSGGTSQAARGMLAEMAGAFRVAMREASADGAALDKAAEDGKLKPNASITKYQRGRGMGF